MTITVLKHALFHAGGFSTKIAVSGCETNCETVTALAVKLLVSFCYYMIQVYNNDSFNKEAFLY